MKRYSFLLCSFFMVLQNYGQTWQWATSAPRVSYATMTDIVITDVHGNAIIGGEGAYNNGPGGIFIIKYGPNGVKLWEIFYPGYGSFSSLCSDTLGNIYASFFIPDVDTMHFSQSSLSILAKYDSNGNLIWCKQPGLGMALAERTDAQNNIIVTGSVIYPVQLENGCTLTATSGHSKRFLAKFDTNGGCIWALQDDGGQYIPISNSKGEIFTKATMYDTTTVGKGSHQVTLYPANGQSYCAKYDSLGTLIWVKQNNTNDYTADDCGNTYTFEPDVSDLTHHSNKNIYLIKYDSVGNILWKRTHIYLDNGYRFAMKCNSQGNVYITGGFTNYMTIDSSTIYDGGNTRAFVAKIDSSGALQWITTSSGAGGAGAKDITVANGNEIYVVGDIGSGQSIFGSHSISEANGIFVAKLIDNTSTLNIDPEHLQSSNPLQIFPNPSPGVFNLSYYSIGLAKLTLRVTNGVGQIVYEETITSPGKEYHKELDLGKNAKGIYFVEIFEGDLRTLKKIVLE